MFIGVQSLQRRLVCDVQTGGVGSAVTNPDMLIPHEVRISTQLFDQDIRHHQRSAEGFSLKTVCEIQERMKKRIRQRSLEDLVFC